MACVGICGKAGRNEPEGSSMNTQSSPTEAELWLRVFCPNGTMSPARARFLLELTFSEQDKTRMRQLSAKARAGELTADEEVELDHYEQIGTVLSILKSKGRQALKKKANQSA
jgi:hypothetical protein